MCSWSTGHFCPAGSAGRSNRACAFRSTQLSSVPPRADDPQHGFGASHLAYLPARVSGHLPPFPVWTAFPSSEYYGGSVALRLAARRAIPHSHGAGRVERDVGASFASLNGMRSHRPPRGRFERRRLCAPIATANVDAASFNPASNGSRPNHEQRPLPRDPFEPSSIQEQAARKLAEARLADLKSQLESMKEVEGRTR